jgi:hypothetical protein
MNNENVNLELVKLFFDIKTMVDDLENKFNSMENKIKKIDVNNNAIAEETNKLNKIVEETTILFYNNFEKKDVIDMSTNTTIDLNEPINNKNNDKVDDEDNDDEEEEEEDYEKDDDKEYIDKVKINKNIKKNNKLKKKKKQKIFNKCENKTMIDYFMIMYFNKSLDKKDKIIFMFVMIIIIIICITGIMLNFNSLKKYKMKF